MKINKVECEQFAGVRDREINFTDGMNIIVGENESGKSTMVDLIYHLLFRNIKIDGRGSKSEDSFNNLYFPKKVSGPQGDVIDGILKFETANGRYRLSKEWEKGAGSCKLTLPDGTIIKSEDEIQTIIAKELGYGEGVLSEIVFPSQKRQQNAIESILKELPTKATKSSERINLVRGDLMSTLNTAVLETGGVSLDKLETYLKSILDAYIEKWDYLADSPEGGVKRGIENKWSCAVTKDADAGKKAIILRAFYDMKDIESLQSGVLAAEKKVVGFKFELKRVKKAKSDIEKARIRFQDYRSVLGQLTLLGKQLTTLKNDKIEQERVLEIWPRLETNLKYAMELRVKYQQAKIRDMFYDIQILHKEYMSHKRRLSEMIPVEQEDVTKVKECVREQNRLEGQLTGLNLVAKIKKLGDVDVEITSIATGENLHIVGDAVNIEEAVCIKIPGIMEMQLTQPGIDMAKIKQQLEKNKEQIQIIYQKYEVTSIEELETKNDEYKRIKDILPNLESNIQARLGDMTWEELKNANEQISEDISIESEIREEIISLCGTKTLDSYIGSLETSLEQYQEKYGNKEKLNNMLKITVNDIDKSEEKLATIEDIPDEYKNIIDPDEFNKTFEDKLEKLDEQLASINESLRIAEIQLGDRSAEEYTEELAKAVARFEEKKAIYSHWKHIYEVFKSLKEESVSNPVHDIEEKFKEYLSLISDGGVSLVSIDEQMNVKLASGSRALTYDILSEGTKDTIALAFRLAMLEHLYPEGGGMAVFDDPFTDMDPQRVGQACQLLQKYAEHNQVIFITCDDKYTKLMSGNIHKMYITQEKKED